VFEQPAGYADEPEPLPDVSALTSADLAGTAGTFLTLGTVGDAGSVRALVHGSPDGYDMLAQSLDSVDSTTLRMVAISLAVSLLAALAGITVAWLLLRRGFRPVDDMIDTAGAIADGDLSKRTDLVESTTELQARAARSDRPGW
jgi:two-component system OmpR family sensor kinase